ncbi:MAG: YbaK/EbsC family protein, partial [Actinomycetes bacterium]
ATIAALVEVMGVDVAETAKVVFFAADGPGQADAPPMEARPVVAVVRGDMTVNETKLAQVIGAADLRPLTDEEITAIGCAAGYASPIGVAGRATVVADDLVAASPNLVMGANQAGFHLRNVNVPRDWTPDLVADIVAAEDGFSCPVCAAPLRTARGVEVGNIFKLGTRYPAALGANYLDRDGTERPVVMGSYGIGMGRLMACIAEEHHDDTGIRWPAAVAPFDVHICALGDQNLSAAESLLDALAEAGLSALLDDRGERPGVQFADADLIGAPLRVTISARSLRAGGVEVLVRDGTDPAVVAPGDVVGWASAHLQSVAAG